MAKSSKPERRKNDRDKRREPKEFEETTLSVDRVTRVVAGGRRMRFRAIVVIGNKKGKVGLGTGKANEVRNAVEKAVKDARRHMVRVPIINDTIPHEVNIKHKAARIRLIPASEGTGVIAGGAVRVILEHAGVKNALSKRFGSSNKLVNAQAMMKALGSLRGTVVGEMEEKKIAGLRTDAQDDAAVSEGIKVKEVSRSDIDKEGNLIVKKEKKKE